MSVRIAQKSFRLLKKNLPAIRNASRVAYLTNFQKSNLPSQRIALSCEIKNIKFYCQDFSSIQIACYDEIKSLPNHPEKVLIDVRDPTELVETGVIPCSINIPLVDVKDALCANEKRFKEKYGRKKPSPDTEVIFSCKSGKRAGKAAEIAISLGYKSVKKYKGSWVDWAERESLPK